MPAAHRAWRRTASHAAAGLDKRLFASLRLTCSRARRAALQRSPGGYEQGGMQQSKYVYPGALITGVQQGTHP